MKRRPASESSRGVVVSRGPSPDLGCGVGRARRHRDVGGAPGPVRSEQRRFLPRPPVPVRAEHLAVPFQCPTHPIVRVGVDEYPDREVLPGDAARRPGALDDEVPVTADGTPLRVVASVLVVPAVPRDPAVPGRGEDLSDQPRNRGGQAVPAGVQVVHANCRGVVQCRGDPRGQRRLTAAGGSVDADQDRSSPAVPEMSPVRGVRERDDSGRALGERREVGVDGHGQHAMPDPGLAGAASAFRAAHRSGWCGLAE